MHYDHEAGRATFAGEVRLTSGSDADRILGLQLGADD